MDTKTMTREVRLRQWAGIMRERKESGKSVRLWCLESGIKEKTFYYWQRQLRAAACEHYAELAHPKSLPPGFAEVKLDERAVHPERTETIQPSEICIEISGMKIKTDSTYPMNMLAALCRELARPC